METVALPAFAVELVPAARAAVVQMPAFPRLTATAIPRKILFV